MKIEDYDIDLDRARFGDKFILSFEKEINLIIEVYFWKRYYKKYYLLDINGGQYEVRRYGNTYVRETELYDPDPLSGGMFQMFRGTAKMYLFPCGEWRENIINLHTDKKTYRNGLRVIRMFEPVIGEDLKSGRISEYKWDHYPSEGLLTRKPNIDPAYRKTFKYFTDNFRNINLGDVFIDSKLDILVYWCEPAIDDYYLFINLSNLTLCRYDEWGRNVKNNGEISDHSILAAYCKYM